MIRDSDQIRFNVDYISTEVKGLNRDAIYALPQQVSDLLDTLKNEPDQMIHGNLRSRIVELERDNRILADQIALMAREHNNLVEEFLKIKRIMEFAMSQKETKENV